MIFNFIQDFIATSSALNPAEAIAQLEGTIKPVIERAAAWGLTAGIGIVGAQAFYTLVIRLIRLD